MNEVDPRFRQMGRGARKRRRRVALWRGAAALAITGVAGTLIWHHYGGAMVARLALAPPDLVQVDGQFDLAPVVRGDTFTDIPGDPLIIPAPDAATGNAPQHLPVPAALAASRRVTAPQIARVEGPLIARDRQLVATLPSTREEFAMFQAERSRERVMNAGLIRPAPGVPEDQRETSSVMFLRDGAARVPLWRDLILETTMPTPAADLLAANGFDGGAAARLGARMQTQMGLEGALPARSVLALRTRMRAGAREVVQLSLYGPQGFVGSLAMNDAGQLVSAADAWADQPLLDDLMARKDAPEIGQQRLLDVIYTSALRDDVPPEIIGQALSLMSQIHDLDSFADPDDRLTLIYADGAGDDPGAVLFAGVTGPSGRKLCYVVPDAAKGFACFDPGVRMGAIAAGPALTPPVAGVLAQRFVPTQNASEGTRGLVRWSAAQGAAVVATGDGTVSRVADDAKLGRIIEIAHEGGYVSRYIGLGALAPGVAKGAAIKRGAALARVAAAPGAAEPGLAYQLLAQGTAIDPIPLLAGGTEVLASESIEALIGHIIRVESAGDARAKNPLSSATGLGQFIDGTWLRMMRNYRPDLVTSLSPRDVLDLRFDANLSRQMVRHLAQENEAFLRARGHSITAGRLYLAHFLGPAGADQVLRADPALSVEAVMGSTVVNANPFLRGYRVADLMSWAEGRMSGRSGAPAMPAPPPIPAQTRLYMAQVDALMRGNPD